MTQQKNGLVPTLACRHVSIYNCNALVLVKVIALDLVIISMLENTAASSEYIRKMQQVLQFVHTI